jgi:ATP-dependent Clp protease ATP-binding subunit ClpB
MDPNRLTEKAREAIRPAQSLAQRHGQSQIEAEHLTLALLRQDGGIAARVVEKAGVSPATLIPRLQQAIDKRLVEAVGAADAVVAELARRHAGASTWAWLARRRLDR